MSRPYLTTEERAGRLLSGGKIESLATPFRLQDGGPFNITIVEKASVTAGVIAAPTNVGLVVNCTLYDDQLPADRPIFFNYPTESLFYEISAGAIDLDDYDVYWSALKSSKPRVEED